jgi:Cu-Zn family superoxide dismutase
VTGLIALVVGVLVVALIGVTANSVGVVNGQWEVVEEADGSPSSLIAIIQPTILNECTGCPIEMGALCNIPSVVGGGDGCVQGWIRFDKVLLDNGEEGAWVRANMSGFPPNSIRHGGNAWHVHISADSSGGDGFTLGGHFNPFKEDHGCPIENGTHRHVGDMGNVYTDKDGNVVGDWYFDMMRFSGPASVTGRSILLFQDPDVCTTMAAGYRWGWGILGICDDACQDKFVHNSTAADCFPEDWDCGEGVELPYDCCPGTYCKIHDEENDIGTCVIDPGM